MSLSDPPDKLLSDRDRCIKEIVDALQRGYLSLFIGGGISMSTKRTRTGPLLFPSWPRLISAVGRATGQPVNNRKLKENEYLMHVADKAEIWCKENGKSFADIVEKALYAKCPDYSKTTLKLDLLVALGSLVMTSLRGSASIVVNYNFDDLLEWYLQLHGFRIKVISEFPSLLGSSDLAIYHPHGFLPKTARFSHLRTKKVIFSKKSYQEATEKSPWNDFQKAVFGTNVALFIGMSGDDFHIETLFGNTYEEIERKRIIGFMFLRDEKRNRDKEVTNRERGIINVYFKKHEDLPDLLLEICQRAAALHT